MESLTVCLLIHHLLCLAVTVLMLHDRLLKAGVWDDKLKTSVLLYILFQSTCPLKYLVHYLSSPKILLMSLLICAKYLHYDWLGLISCNYKGGNWVEGSQLTKSSPVDKPRVRPVSIDHECLFVCVGVCVCLLGMVTWAAVATKVKDALFQPTCDVPGKTNKFSMSSQQVWMEMEFRTTIKTLFLLIYCRSMKVPKKILLINNNHIHSHNCCNKITQAFRFLGNNITEMHIAHLHSGKESSETILILKET